MNEYIRLSENYKYNQLIPSLESPYKYVKNKDQPYFISMVKYTEEQYKEWQKTHSLAGISGAKTNKIWADFDSKDDLKLAFSDAVIFVNKLFDNDIQEEEIQISFSGNKGISVLIETEYEFTTEQVKAFVVDLGDGLETLDRQIYDTQRIFRLNFTKNEKTGLYKIPITWEELGEANIEEIKERAKIPPTQEEIDDVNAYYQVSSFKIPDEYLNITKLEVKSEPVVIGKVDWSAKPKFLSNCRWALQNGMFEPGFRSEPLLCLASTYKNLGYAQGITYRMLKGVAELESQRNNSERYNDKELFNNIVLQVYSDRWKNGQFSCKEPGNFLYDYCNSLGDHSCKHDKKSNETKIRTLVDLAPKFKEYVKNIDKNTILTGIPSIDKNVFISTGANVGIIGAAGCHAKGTKVLMYDGSTKNVEDVVIGDKLMGPDSKPREVLKLYQGKEEMVKIIPYRVEPFIVNKSHILHLAPSHLKNKNRIPGNLNIEVHNYIKGLNDKKRTMLSSYKLVKSSEIEFPVNNDLKIPPYILGLWLGDGSSESISLTTMDSEIKDEWLNFAEKNELKVRIDEQKDNRSKVYYLSEGKIGKTHKILQIFKDYNLINNKHIPDDYLLSSKENRLKLLAGLIDTDGYLEANQKSWEITQKNEKLANQIVFLARSLGFHASLNKVKKSCSKKTGEKIWGTYFTSYISGNNLENVPIKLNRKKPSDKIMRNNVLHYGFKYEILPEDNYYGFTLDKDHLYLTADFMIHHNSGKTSLALDILNNTSKAGVKTVVASLDMAENRMFEKVMYRISQLPRDQLYKIYQDDNEAKLLEKLKTEFGNTYFFQKSMATVSDIREHILDIQDSTGDKVKLVMIDYFERIMSDMSDDTAASKRISGELQDLVNDLDIALITLVQPNKFSIAGGPDKPIRNYTSIKGSSHLYQSFRIIMSLWRPFYTPLLKDHDHYMQMAVLKNDLGELNEFVFNWDGKKGSISEMEDFQKEEFFSLLRQKESDEGNDDNGGWQS